MSYAARAAWISLAGHALLIGLLWFLPGEEPRDPGVILPAGDFTLVWDDSPAPGAETQEPFQPRLVDVAPPPAQISAPEAPGPQVIVPPTVSARPSTPVPGGNGAGGASGGGTGSRIRRIPGHKSPRTVVFLLDCSISMGLHGTLAPARAELRAFLEGMPPTTYFQVIPYHREAEPLSIGGKSHLLPADGPTLRAALARIEAISPTGGTEHLRALRRGLQFRTDALVLITDHLQLPDGGVEEITRLNQGRTVLHILEVSRSRHGTQEPVCTAALLAARNQGSHQRVPLP